MKNLYKFIIKPHKERYNNSIKFDDKELILNTKIETFQSVSKLAEIVDTPINIPSPLEKGDLILVHHNIFRRYYDIRGKEKNGGCYFKDDLFMCDPMQIYMYKKDSWKTNLDYCFVSPIYNDDEWSNNIEKPLIGIVKYSNKYLQGKGIKENCLVGFSPNSEFEFVFEGTRLYCMKSNDIVLNYGYKENEKEYNPSWAKSS